MSEEPSRERLKRVADLRNRFNYTRDALKFKIVEAKATASRATKLMDEVLDLEAVAISAAKEVSEAVDELLRDVQ